MQLCTFSHTPIFFLTSFFGETKVNKLANGGLHKPWTRNHDWKVGSGLDAYFDLHQVWGTCEPDAIRLQLPWAYWGKHGQWSGIVGTVLYNIWKARGSFSQACIKHGLPNFQIVYVNHAKDGMPELGRNQQHVHGGEKV